jgi:hypothetical protein
VRNFYETPISAASCDCVLSLIKGGTAVIILLAGGGKTTQQRDIAMARELARNL